MDDHMCLFSCVFISFILWIFLQEFIRRIVSIANSCIVRLECYILLIPFNVYFGFICRYPFNWKTPFGYIAAMSFQLFIFIISLIICFSSMLFPISFCVFLTAFCEDLENDLHEQNENLRIHSAPKIGQTNANRNEMKQKICDIIRFHCDAKQLSRRNFIRNSIFYTVLLYFIN